MALFEVSTVRIQCNGVECETVAQIDNVGVDLIAAAMKITHKGWLVITTQLTYCPACAVLTDYAHPDG